MTAAVEITTALAEAIREAFEAQAGITQTELAARVGQVTEGKATQGMVSRWARGEVTPDVPTIWAIEEACGLRRGWIFHKAGLLDLDVETILSSDPDLDSEGRKTVVSFYRYVRDEHPRRASS